MMKLRGFTLIELIVVIVILGILAAIVLPRFINLKDDAEKAVVESMIGSIAAARSMFIAKAAVCGSSYTTSGLGFFTFLHFDQTLSRPPTCDDFNNGWGSVTPGPVATMDLYPIKQSLQDNPANTLNSTWTPPSTEVFSFTSKTGRTINISHNTQSGALNWSASPAY